MNNGIMTNRSPAATPNKKQRRSSVADLAARYEQPKKEDEESTDDDRILTTLRSTLDIVADISNDLQTRSDHAPKKPINPRASFSPTKVEFSSCIMCQKKLFPTDHTITCRHQTYHVGCFRCSLCCSKMKNHPDEEHKLVQGPQDGEEQMVLQCGRCKIDNEQMRVPRRKSTVAGERIVVAQDEQGDIHNVVEAIGDDLEDAVWGMIPRCAMCGGDFLSYDDDISIVGSLKYHKDCFLVGKPGAGSNSLTLLPVIAARYLPEHFILKLSNGAGKAITTLFFVWKDRESAIKTMRLERIEEVDLTYNLDDEARANPNYEGKTNAPRKPTVQMPSQDGEEGDLHLELIGGKQIAPKQPEQVGPVRVVKGYRKPSYLEGTVRYSKYKLEHKLIINIPLNWKCDTLRLLGTTVRVQIHDPAES